MTTPQENIIVDSCQYTPVYLIQTPGAIQGRSYVVTQTSVEEPKPVSDNLKRFYESSGFLENNLNNVTYASKPQLLKNQDGKFVGNNLKLANFLLPKSDILNRPYVAINNVVLKSTSAPPMPTVTTSRNNTVPRVEVDRKIVKMNIPAMLKTPERTTPKIRPKEKIVQSIPSPTQSKHTSVQLLKLGETYHSLNQLSDEQMKMVNQALKIFSNPEKAPMEPKYDPVTNTKFIYKVVSPRDLTVVGKNKILFKNKKEMKKLQEEEEEESKSPPEIKITRSGRKVKFPKQIVPEENPQKPRKKSGTVVSCFQCSTEFSSLYRLQKHYEMYPTHIPAKIHSNLFHCLLAIIKSGSEEDRANIFIQQLEQLIEKIKSVLPCLLKKIDGNEETGCNVNDDIGKLFGINPGKYNLDMEALTCVKSKDGFCRHNPPKNNHVITDKNKLAQGWLSKHTEETANNDNESEDCARINAIDNWPKANKRIWKIKKQISNELKAKRMRLASESGETIIELGVEDLITFAAKSGSVPNVQSAINIPHKNTISPKNIKIENRDIITDEIENIEKVDKPNTPSKIDIVETKKAKAPHIQFHSTHFDIRSSPIKPSAAVFCKFQIDPEKIAKYDVQVIRPLDLDNKQTEVPQEEIPTIETNTDNCDLQSILNQVDLSCKDSNVSHELSFEKDWIINSSNEKSVDNYLKSDSLIEPSLIHVKDLTPLCHTDKLPLSNSVGHCDRTLGNSINHSNHTQNNSINHTLSNGVSHNSHVLSDGVNHTDHILSDGLNHSDHSLSNGINHSDHTLSNGINHNNHSLTNRVNHTDHTLSNSISHSDNTLSNGIICSDHTLGNSLSHSDHAPNNGINHNHTISDGLNHNDHTLDNGLSHTNLVHNDHLAENDCDHRLQGQSVLNFLDSLGSDCLAYPETDIRNTTVDFQLDLFSFHNS